MEDFGSPALQRLLAEQAQAVLDTHAQHGDATALVERAKIVEVLTLLRDDPALEFDMLTDLTAVDYNWFGPDPWVMPLATRAGVSEDTPDWLPPWPQQRPWEDMTAPTSSGGVEISRAAM